MFSSSMKASSNQPEVERTGVFFSMKAILQPTRSGEDWRVLLDEQPSSNQPEVGRTGVFFIR